MFKTSEAAIDAVSGGEARRSHRYLTVPVLLLAFVLLLFTPYFLFSLLLFPPVAALPWVMDAAGNPTAKRVADAHQAIRAAGHIICALGVVILIMAFMAAGGDGGMIVAGIIELAISQLILLVVGRAPRESRLGAAVMLLGLMLAIASLGLMWLDARMFLLLPDGVLMFAAGVWWLIDAEAAPVVDSHLPTAVALT